MALVRVRVRVRVRAREVRVRVRVPQSPPGDGADVHDDGAHGTQALPPALPPPPGWAAARIATWSARA